MAFSAPWVRGPVPPAHATVPSMTGPQRPVAGARWLLHRSGPPSLASQSRHSAGAVPHSEESPARGEGAPRLFRPQSLAAAAATAYVAARSVIRGRRQARRSAVGPRAVKPASQTPEAGGGLTGYLSQFPRNFWRFMILVLCMIWATNFAVIKEITAQPGVSTQLYVVSRFTVAAVSLFPFLFSISSRKVFLRAAQCGAWVACGYIGQAIGLMTTTAAKSCFICSLNVVFVSAVIAVTKRVYDPQTAIAALLAISGVGLLELIGSQHPVIGDLFSLAQPICFGMGYIRLEEIMADSPKDALGVTATKLLMVALGSWSYYFFTTGGFPNFAPVLASGPALAGVLWCGLVTTSLSLVLESVAFQYVDATSASVIFTTEPLWAALFAMWLISEPFSMMDGVGGLLVIAANIVKELPASWLPFGKKEVAEKTLASQKSE